MPRGRTRKFSGPLLPGQTSVRKGSKTLAKKYRAAKSQARYNPSVSRNVVNRMIYNQLSKFSESKILPLRKYNESAPLPIQIGAQAYFKAFVLGENIPANWSGSFETLSGIACIQGDLSTQRQGNYVYLNKTHLTMEIDMSSNIETNVPHEFRVIMFKERRATDPAGFTKNPAVSLFLSQIGAPEGHETGGINGTDLMCQPLNKRDWVIMRDQRFLLSPPQTIPESIETAAGYSGKYPVFKRMVFNMPHKIKARYPPEGATLTEPVNYDFRYGIIVYARAIGKDQRAQNWEVNIRGATSFMDN